MTIGLLVFGACMLLSWTQTVLHLIDPGRMNYTQGPGLPMHSVPLSRIAILGMGTIVVVGVTGAFVFQTYPLVAALIYLVVLAVYRQWEKVQWEGDIVVKLGKYVPAAAALLGYVLGCGIAILIDYEDPYWAGWEVACGFMGACYSLAGVAKWLKVGSKWFDGIGMQMLIYERSLLSRGLLKRIRERSGRSWRLCAGLTGGGFLVELFGFMYIFPSLRLLYLGLAAPMVVGFFVFLGYFELEWALVLIALTLLSAGY
jgi:hypothetical protein